MIATTNTGEKVDLTDPERFCSGMVFEIVGAVHGSRCSARFVLVKRNMGDGNHGASWECWGDGGGDWKMVADWIREREEPSAPTARAAWIAYRRALATHCPPLRERLTWKTRGPRLTVDDGRDE